MARVNQVKTDEQYTIGSIEKKVKLNLNDLLERREKEKKADRKINLVILSGATAIAAVIIVVLGF